MKIYETIEQRNIKGEETLYPAPVLSRYKKYEKFEQRNVKRGETLSWAHVFLI